MTPSFAALAKLAPVFLSYVLSFVYIAIYWVNHHHMLHTVSRVNGAILWANTHLLFWLSLVPFTTGWMGENHFAAAPDSAVWRLPVDAGNRLLHLADGDHPHRRAGQYARQGRRCRLER